MDMLNIILKFKERLQSLKTCLAKKYILWNPMWINSTSVKLLHCAPPLAPFYTENSTEAIINQSIQRSLNDAFSTAFRIMLLMLYTDPDHCIGQAQVC